MSRFAPPGPSLYPECGGMTGYKRHTDEGTVTCAACREAARVGEARYRKERYLYGPRKIPALGSRRRVQALHAIGWTFGEIGARMSPPITSEAVAKLIHRDLTYRDKANQIAAIYDALWDRPRSGTQGATRARNRSAKDGWLPPMAWDDERMDDPDYVPLEKVLRDWDEALAIEKTLQKTLDRRRWRRSQRTPEQIERDRASARARKARYRARTREQAAA